MQATFTSPLIEVGVLCREWIEVDPEGFKDRGEIAEAANLLAIPDNLLGAFYAYYLDFLDKNMHGSFADEGAFVYEEDGDLLSNILLKFQTFFCPIADAVESIQSDWELIVNVEPCDSDGSAINIIASSPRTKEMYYVVAYHEYWVPWEAVSDPENICSKLEDICNKMSDNLKYFEDLLDLRRSMCKATK